MALHYPLRRERQMGLRDGVVEPGGGRGGAAGDAVRAACVGPARTAGRWRRGGRACGSCGAPRLAARCGGGCRRCSGGGGSGRGRRGSCCSGCCLSPFCRSICGLLDFGHLLKYIINLVLCQRNRGLLLWQHSRRLGCRHDLHTPCSRLTVDVRALSGTRTC